MSKLKTYTCKDSCATILFISMVQRVGRSVQRLWVTTDFANTTHRLPQMNAFVLMNGKDDLKLVTKYLPVAAGMGEQERRLVRLRDRRTPRRVVLDADVDILISEQSNYQEVWNRDG